MIPVAGPEWVVWLPGAVGIFSALGAIGAGVAGAVGGTAGAVAGGVAVGATVGAIGAGIATIARHIQGFVEGNPWWEDPVGDFKQHAVGMGTGIVGGGLAGGLGPLVGSALGSVAASEGAAAGTGTLGTGATGQVLKQGVQNAVSQGALGAARSGLSGDDPLRGGLSGAAGGFASGAGGAALGGGPFGNAQGPNFMGPQEPPSMGASLGNFAARQAPQVGSRLASAGVSSAMTPPPPAPPQDPFAAYNRPPQGNPLYRYDRF